MLFFLLIVLVLLISIIVNYVILSNQAKRYEEKIQDLHVVYKTEPKIIKKKSNNDIAKNEKIPNKKTKKPTEIIKQEIIREPENIKKISMPRTKPLVKVEPIVDDIPMIVPNNEIPEVVEVVDNTPMLAIVCDDVSTKRQVNKIKKIGFPVTIAFLPPTSRHKKSALIAQNLSYYMIHFPLEASAYKFAEEGTLSIKDNYNTIEKRVAQLQKLYPKANYVNNHTGSTFTANEQSMDKFMRALKKYNFSFLDSKTTRKSVARKYALKYEVPYLSRNIFLDNVVNEQYIQIQLKKAVKIAKRDGYAIAICHPHSISLKTLKKSKHLLKGVKLVLINKL